MTRFVSRLLNFYLLTTQVPVPTIIMHHQPPPYRETKYQTNTYLRFGFREEVELITNEQSIMT